TGRGPSGPSTGPEKAAVCSCCASTEVQRAQRDGGEGGGTAGAAGGAGAWGGRAAGTPAGAGGRGAGGLPGHLRAICPRVEDMRKISARVVGPTSGSPAGVVTGKRTVYMVQKSPRYG